METYFVYRVVIQPAATTPRGGNFPVIYEAVLTLFKRLKARTAEAALAEAKGLGIVAPVVGKENLQ